MKKYLLLPAAGVLALAASILLTPPPQQAVAQVADEPLAASSSLPEPAFSRLRAMPYFYVDVTSSTNAADEAELRNELRDIIELEMRRAEIRVRALTPSDSAENAAPYLRLNIKWERGASRADCILELSVQDKVSIVRNREEITAIIFEMRRPVNILTEQTAMRDVKARSRDLIREFVRGVKKVK